LAFIELLKTIKWWRWRELNPRPKARHFRHYMLSPLFSLVGRQHNVRSTPANIPALVDSGLTGRHLERFHDNDPTPTSMDTSGFGAKP